MKTGFRSQLALVFAGLALAAVAAGDAWRRINYPDYVRGWPQMKGMMLGASGEKEFADLHRMGATLVRYQMHASWSQFTNAPDAVAAFNTRLDEWLDHLDEMLPWSRKYGIKICVDMHTHIGGATKEKYSSDMIFVEKKYEDLLVATWERIARRFKGNEDAIYGYDLFNEPIDRENKLTTTTWRAVFCRTIEAIRAIDPVTPIVVEPNCNASPRGFDVKNIYGLKGFEPLLYDNLIYSVHVYQPMEYTHQGLFKSKADYNPVDYPNKAKGWDKEFVRKEIQSVRDFQLKTGARIYVGEFSAVAYAPGAEKYLNDLCELFREYGWDWTYHAFRESFCWSVEHESVSCGMASSNFRRSKDNARMRVLKKGLKGELAWKPAGKSGPSDVCGEQVDVCVVGGGTAGVSAALQAGRAGVRTLLIEQGSQVGGNMTSGGVNFPGLFHAWGRQVIAGAGWDLVTNAVATTGGTLPDFSKLAGRQHWRHQITINVPVWVALAEEALGKAGVNLRYHSAPVAVRRDADGMWILTVAMLGELRDIRARQIIDCTGNGAVAALAGAERLRGEKTAPGSFWYTLSYPTPPTKEQTCAAAQAFSAAVASGELKSTDARWGFGDPFRTGAQLGNYVDAADNSTAELRTDTTRRGRASMLRLYRFLRRQPGYEGVQIAAMAAETGVRETYRVKGRYVMTHADYVEGRMFSDAVCHAFYPIDLHDTASGIHPKHLADGMVANVPLRALQVAGYDGLWVAGRCISSDRLANSALRVEATCMATGQVAGEAAALAAAQGIKAEAIPLDELKRRLRASGAIVP